MNLVSKAFALSVVLALGACATQPPAPSITQAPVNKCKDAKVSLEDARCR